MHYAPHPPVLVTDHVARKGFVGTECHQHLSWPLAVVRITLQAMESSNYGNTS
jgi:hypothetical protein